VIVARYLDFRSENLPVAPLLAVEVLSRSTRLKDLNLKRAHYERSGVDAYWILDPKEPGALTAFELDGGIYSQVAHVEAEAEFVATRPFPVTVVPARLLDGLRPRE
jgi:Uma2 family endonuclease